MNIRAAREDDLDAMIDYGKPFWEKTIFYAECNVPYDRDTVRKVMTECLDNGVALVLDNKGKIDAFLLVLTFPCLMNQNYTFAMDYAFYVSRELRGQKIGQKLIEQATEILREQGVTLFTLVSMEASTPDTANDLYQRLGFKHSETGFSKELI